MNARDTLRKMHVGVLAHHVSITSEEIKDLMTKSSFAPIVQLIYIEVFTDPEEECWWFTINNAFKRHNISLM